MRALRAMRAALEGLMAAANRALEAVYSWAQKAWGWFVCFGGDASDVCVGRVLYVRGCRLCGFENFRTRPQPTLVSRGSFISFEREAHIVFGSPSNRRPQPRAKSVSPGGWLGCGARVCLRCVCGLGEGFSSPRSDAPLHLPLADASRIILTPNQNPPQKRDDASGKCRQMCPLVWPGVSYTSIPRLPNCQLSPSPT
jgi:hypothetical protein